MLSKAFRTGVAAALGLVLSSTAAMAQKAETVESGRTRVRVSTSLVAALSSLGVKLGIVESSGKYFNVVDFPIVSGAIDLDTAKGQIVHSGGLTLSAGKTLVKLQSFIVDTSGTTPVLTGIVVADGKFAGRIPLFDIQLPAGLSLPLKPGNGTLLSLYGSTLTLTSEAAGALNGAFSVSAFKQGLNVGRADIVAMVGGPEDARN